MPTQPPVLIVANEAQQDGLVTILQSGASGLLGLSQLGQLHSLFTLNKEKSAKRRRSSDTQLIQQIGETVFRASRDAICITDSQGNIELVNDAFSELAGYPPREVIGLNPRILKSGVQDEAFYKAMWETLLAHGHWHGEIINRRKDGSIYSEWLRIFAIRNDQGEVTHYFSIAYDLTEKKLVAERINYLSQFDPLTRLPNRALLNDRLEHALLTAQRNGESVAVMLLDIDRFRQLNDTLGQRVGDQILTETARRMESCIRGADTVARISGNEFCFVLPQMHEEGDIVILAQRVLHAIAKTFELHCQQVNSTASIGISVFPKDQNSADELLHAANSALSRAKQAGGNTMRFYSPDMESQANRRLLLEGLLRRALNNNEFEMHYQPQISLESGTINGAEALIRWTTPDLGRVSPAEFIPIAEECGLIESIGAWALSSVCAQVREWQQQGYPQIRVAVNLSTRQFRDANLVRMVEDAIRQNDIPASLIELEITESSLIHDLESAVETCRALKRIGVRLSLDDFGTGYSSLSYVSRLPFDKLKVDQAFVSDITQNPANAAIATAAIAMARGLNLSVLAEGVETEAQAIFLRGRHCDAIQGYLFSPPLPADEFAHLIMSNKRLRLSEQSTKSDLTLLAVDDEPSILNTLVRLFRHENFQVLTARDPETAFDLLARHKVQVIISDQRMPGMTGTEFLARARLLYPNTARIVLSGYTELETVMHAINRGAVYKFLTKPWDDDELRELVREAFRLVRDAESR